jgi:acyl-CoA synthetase (AMP-forming)/AMP-acid ligase II
MRLPELDYPPTMPAVVRRASTLYGDQPFIVMPDRRMSYIQAEQASRRLASSLLATGVGKGTRVAAMFPYGADFVVTWLAVTRIGAVFMPLSTVYKPAELRKVLLLGDVERLIIPPRLNDSDHVAFVEEAIPGLASSGEDPMWLPELPYLRSVWVAGGAPRAWAHALTVDFRDATPADPAVPEALLEAAEGQVTPADWKIVVFTSGTTSIPKAVVHTHGNFLRHGFNLGRFQGFDTGTKSFCGMPFFWIGGVGLGLNMALAGGSTILCLERFEPDAALDLMEAEGANHIGMWPQLAQRLRQHISSTGRDVSRIPALAPPPGVPYTTDIELKHNSLGMTETVGPHSAAGPESERVLPEEMRGSFGALVPYVEHRIAEPQTNATLPFDQEGEVCIRGYSLMAGLYKTERHDTFDDDGWYHTGDRAVIRDGYLYFKGRLSEMIKTSGSNVAPREVEMALESFEEVGLAVVMGLPDPVRGETVAVALAPRPGGAAIDPEHVLERLDKEISSYKVPRRVLVLGQGEVPYLPSGKPDRLRLRQMVETSSVPFEPRR